MTDDQGYGDFGVHGNPVLRTPNLDALAADGTRLSRFYVCPVCAPTRAGLMTGRYHYRTRVVDTYIGRAMMDPGEITVAELLRGAGWATGIFGKWHLGDCPPMRSIDQGFEEAWVHRGGGIGQSSDPAGAEGRYTDAVLFHNGEPTPTEGYCTDVYFDRAGDWIERQVQRRRPFFAYVAPNCPHGPFDDVPESLYSAYRERALENARFPQDAGHALPAAADVDRRARIFAMIENIDENVGRLLARLDALGVAADTLVLFMVDNGPNGRRYVAGYRGMKTEVWEGGVRSPLFARWPAALPAGPVRSAVGAYIDIAPTILDACGVAPPSRLRLDGVSLLPALRDGAPLPPRHIFIQAHRGDRPHAEHHIAVIGPRWKLVRPSGFGRQQPEPGAPFELYDLQTDPYEQRDLAGDLPATVARLRAAYRAWFTDVTQTRPAGPPRIVIGMDVPVVVLTRQDWRVSNRRHDRGRWRLRVARAGSYQLDLRFAPVAEGTELAVHCGDAERRLPLRPGQRAARIDALPLAEGGMDLVAELRGPEPTRGAHQVEVRPTSQ